MSSFQRICTNTTAHPSLIDNIPITMRKLFSTPLPKPHYNTPIRSLHTCIRHNSHRKYSHQYTTSSKNQQCDLLATSHHHPLSYPYSSHHASFATTTSSSSSSLDKPLSRNDSLSEKQLNSALNYRMPLKSYDEAFKWSIENRTDYWYDAAKSVIWDNPPKPDEMLDESSKPFYKWYPNASLNTCYNALDVHVRAGSGEQVAMIYDSPVTKTLKKFTYNQLLDEVSKLAAAMQVAGIGKGDRVLIYMPMIPEATWAMLACARIGAIHSVVFGGFAGAELAKRIVDAKPKLIFTASGGIEPSRKVPYMPMVNDAIEISKHTPEAGVVVVQRDCLKADLKEGRDTEWYQWVKEKGQGKKADAVSVKSTDPLYILYTSGTTGTPKGVVRDNGGHAVALKWAMKYIFAMNKGEAYWSASDIGWVVGHSFIVYGPLLQGCTTVLYEGKPIGTPDAGAFWRVISEHGVKRMFTAPTAIRAIKKEDPEGELCSKYNLDKFEALYLAGERADPDTVEWAKNELKKPVIDNYWQTESGWPIITNCAGIELLPIKSGSATKPVPGYEVQIVDENGKQVRQANENGNIAIKLPLPPGTFPTLWHNDKRFVESYMSKYPGYYDSSDSGYIDDDGYVWVMSRTDDVLNVAGHRLSSGGIEEVLAHHPAVAEAAVIGVVDKIKGEIPVGFVVLKGGKTGVIESEKSLENELVKAVREKVGAVAAMKRVLVVKRLPKTRSGKILRNLMRKIADRQKYTVTPTIEDPAALDEVKEVIYSAGIQPNMEADSQIKEKVKKQEQKAEKQGTTTAS